MSRADSKSVERGTTITTDDLNEKFSDLKTITSGNIDETNLRNEAVDQPNLEFRYGTGGDQGYVLKAYGSMDNNASTDAQNYASNTGPVHLSHTGAGGENTMNLSSSPFEVKYGDVIRVYWDLVVKDHSFGNINNATNTQTGAFWAAWLQWNVGAWTEVPNTTDLSVSRDVSDSADTHGLMIIPHAWRMYTVASASYQGLTLDKTSFRQAWYYKSNTVSTITISGFRLMISGVYKSYQDASENSQLNHDTDWDSDSLVIAQINMKALHRGGG